jgi:hypothetical protein
MPVGYRLGCLGVSGDVNYRKLLMFMSRDVISTLDAEEMASY